MSVLPPMQLLLLSASLLACAHQNVGAQVPVTAKGDTVVINCPQQTELRVIVDYVGQVLGMRFLYGEELSNQKVELRPSPVELPKKHLKKLLVSMLRVRGLAMVEESPGLYRIVRADQTTRSAATLLPAGAGVDPESSRLVTCVLPVPSGNVKAVADRLARFMSTPKGSLITVPERGLIVLTEYESRIALLRELITILDAGGAPIDVRVTPVTGGDPAVLAAQVSTILTERHRLRKTRHPPASLRGDVLPGSIVVVGTAQQIEEATDLMIRFAPEAVDLRTRTYAPRYIGVDRALELIENVLFAPGSELARPASTYRDPRGGRLFVTAEPATQTAIAELLKTEDQPLPETHRALRIYRPRYRKAGELLVTLSQLLGAGDGETAVATPLRSSERSDSTRPRAGIVEAPPVPPQAAQASDKTVHGPDYVLTEDEHTNSILAIGTREFHAQLESLIDRLDHRRAQVLIEMTLVAITLSDSMELGVELEGLDLGDAWDYLVFTNFGLSSIDAVTGQRTITPGVGVSGILLSPDVAPILIHALATRGAAKVISTPKLLVSDNARASLRNVDEAPFTSVNASDTVATTSFAGFESAGTTLSVTPHISEGNHVTLEYELTFSNFSGSSGSAAVPPPRTTNSFTSTVEVPDGHTVVTGGLVVRNDSNSLSEVPLLGQIPGLGWLFRSMSRQKTQTKIFAFIRPTVLREDRFEALRSITLKDIELAELGEGLTPPSGEPLWMP